MAITPGTRLGVYEVTTQIGEGGMGEVYRPTDTTLKRQVALKVLPASDGQKFLVVDDGVRGMRPLTLIQNWTAPLKK